MATFLNNFIKIRFIILNRNPHIKILLLKINHPLKMIIVIKIQGIVNEVSSFQKINMSVISKSNR